MQATSPTSSINSPINRQKTKQFDSLSVKSSNSSQKRTRTSPPKGKNLHGNFLDMNKLKGQTEQKKMIKNLSKNLNTKVKSKQTLNFVQHVGRGGQISL